VGSYCIRFKLDRQGPSARLRARWQFRRAAEATQAEVPPTGDPQSPLVLRGFSC
jgi:hypothetical protein